MLFLTSKVEKVLQVSTQGKELIAHMTLQYANKELLWSKLGQVVSWKSC